MFAKAGAKIVSVDVDVEGMKRVAGICQKESPYQHKVIIQPIVLKIISQTLLDLNCSFTLT